MPTLTLSAARQLASDQLLAGNPSAAFDIVKAIRRDFPLDYGAAVLAGRAELAAGDTERARDTLRRAAQIVPDDGAVRRLLAQCGSDADAAVAADLIPPLDLTTNERTPISAVGLGHLFLRQDLPVHASSQLRPIWKAHPERLDVGLALAHAVWRLGNNDEAVEICEQLRQVDPECLKANLILGQILFASGNHEAAAPLLEAATAVDPENTEAAELYAWLVPRNESLVPVHQHTLDIQVSEPQPIPSQEDQKVEAMQEVAVDELAAELETDASSRWGPETDPNRAFEPGSEAPTAPALGREDLPERSPAYTDLPEAEQTESQPVLKLLPSPYDTLLQPPVAPPPAENPLAPWERPRERVTPSFALDDLEESSADAAGDIPFVETRKDADDVPVPAAATPPTIAPTAGEAHLPDAEGVLATLELSPDGQITYSSVTPSQAASWTIQLQHWTAAWQSIAQPLGLGAARYAIIESDKGALHLSQQPEHTSLAVTNINANLGLVRVRLRRRQVATQETNQEQETNSWNEH